jgi:ankyrin repeat protein
MPRDKFYFVYEFLLCVVAFFLATVTGVAAEDGIAAIYEPGNDYTILESTRDEAVLVELFDRYRDDLTNGNNTEIQKWLDANPGILERHDGTGATSLHIVAHGGHSSTAELLIANGANVHARDSEGFTPLHNATERGHLEVISVLLANEARVNDQNGTGTAPLALSVVSSNTAVTKLLLEHGASVGAKDMFDETALDEAALYGNVAAVELLLEYGANVSEDNSYLGTPLVTVASGRDGALQIVKSQAVKAVQAEKLIGFQISQDVGTDADYHHILDRFLALGAKVSVRNRNGQTPLHTAAAGGNVYAMKRLLKLDADVGARDARGGTALHAIASTTHPKSDVIGELLLSREAEIDPVTNPGERSSISTPLIYAAYFGNTKLVRLLVAKGANVNAQNELGRSVLHKAAQKDHTEVIEVLLGAGADPSILDSDGGTALHLAANEGNSGAVEALISGGADPNSLGANKLMQVTPLHLAAAKGDEVTVQILLANDARTDLTIPNGNTARAIAVARGNGVVAGILQEVEVK